MLRVSVVSLGGFMATVERTAYPRFRRFMSARELHVFYTPAVGGDRLGAGDRELR